ncbi:MAG: LL-diaminopimelate aminotransferase [Candidatus Omnitrophica bacterium]|nr:LL-diaminopimelate aminotransferase [Candidatus Omnitrophota bacterium]
MNSNIARRLKNLPPYLFLEIERTKRKAAKLKRNIIDFGVGDPDQPPPFHIIEALYRAAKDPLNHRYALGEGMLRLRRAMADWYKRRFRVSLNPENEILPLLGSKEGIAHLPLAFLNPGDYSLVSDPCYPPYKTGTILAGGRVYSLPLLEKNDYLPDLKKVPRRVLKKAKLIYVNYPNNPTTAVADKNFYKELIEFAKKNNLIVLSDFAYSEITFDGYRATSFLQIEGAKNVGLEFHSLSKTYNMTGWRIGWVCGNKNLVSALAKVKSNIDSGIFIPIQFAGLAALEGPQQHIQKMCRIYEKRRDILVEGLTSLGWQVKRPKATFYVWAKTPAKIKSLDFARSLLKKAGIVVTPGVGFGKYGEGYMRFALTLDSERIREAIKRLRRCYGNGFRS